MEIYRDTEAPTLDATHFEDISAEHSQNLLTIRGVLAAQFYRYLEPEAWSLLVEAQHTSRANNEQDSVTALMLDPSTGGWLSQLIPYELADPQTGTTQERDEDFWWHILHGYTIAASAAIQAGVPSFSIKVPVWSGRVTLPGLGQAVLQDTPRSDSARDMALVTASQDSIIIEGCNNRIELARSGENNIPEWKETARIVVEGVEPDTRWGVILDDTNPYRLTSPPIAPADDIHQFRHATHQHTEEEWIDLTRASMTLLVRDHPQMAHDISREVRSIVPLSFKPQAIRLRPYSASGSAAAGGIELDYQHYPDVAAASLVHEGAHNKYYGLVLKDPFISKEWSSKPYLNSPWRSDIRPATGHLLGIDAFSSVAEFWRQRLDPGIKKNSREANLAAYEVAFLRFQIGLALGQIDKDDSVLTEEGQAFIDHILKPRIEHIDQQAIPILTTSAAKDAVEYHIAMWRAHHYRPAASLVANIVQSWKKGEECPSLTSEPDKLVPGKGYYFDLWSTFHRLSIAEPVIFDTLVRNPQEIAEHVQGAQPRDILSFAGRADEAKSDYCHELENNPHIDPRTVVGLGYTMQGFGEILSSGLLKSAPHIYRAVLQKIIDCEIERPHPINLLEWMTGGYGARQNLGIDDIATRKIMDHLQDN